MDEITKWLYLSDINHLVVREWVNGLWFAISFAMCFEFGKSLLHRIYKLKYKWREDIATRAMAALFGYFSGEVLVRGWVWILLAAQNSGNPLVEYARADYHIAFIAAALSTWGALCCLYVFSRNHWVWFRAAMIIVAFLIIEAIIL